jgi:glucose/arabinose dehydrogenase
MLRFRPDGSQPETFATGLRNSVGFDWQPGTNALYATDNGRDLLGDDFPPCELNRLEAGGFYGWPVANGDRKPDPDFGKGQDDRIRTSIPPAHGFGAHTAPLGIAFPSPSEAARRVARRRARRATRVLEPYEEEWLSGRLAALEGGWLNRGAPVPVGFEKDENVIGRPVDVVESGDGTIYVSDDYASSVYWVRFGESVR